MNGRRASADESHAMTTSLRYSHHDQLAELVERAAGRFGRKVRRISQADPGMAPIRTTEVDLMRERLKKSGYQVDSTAVASAILERLLAGGLTPPIPKS